MIQHSELLSKYYYRLNTISIKLSLFLINSLILQIVLHFYFPDFVLKLLKLLNCLDIIKLMLEQEKGQKRNKIVKFQYFLWYSVMTCVLSVSVLIRVLCLYICNYQCVVSVSVFISVLCLYLD